MDKPVYLGLSLLSISKIAMHEYSHEYIKPKYEDNAKLCYMDTDNFIVHVKTEEIFANIETRLDTFLYQTM